MIWIRTNGIGHAFSRELGCNCRRCRTVNFTLAPPPRGLVAFSGWDDPPWRAHTSASILVGDPEGEVKGHVLIDCGAGVVDSLVCSGLEGLDRMSALLLTHWHPDHVLSLSQLCESLRRSAQSKNGTSQKLPVHCTLHTYERLRDSGGFAREFESLLTRHDVQPGVPFPLVAGHVDMLVTPLPVAHRDVEGAVIFVASMDGKTAVFAWDIDVPSATPPHDTWTNQDIVDAHLRDLRPDVLFIDANTWSATGTGHTTFELGRRYLHAINAKQVYLTHLSGHEDDIGASGYGWPDAEWEAAVQSERIGVARQGMILRL